MRVFLLVVIVLALSMLGSAAEPVEGKLFVRSVQNATPAFDTYIIKDFEKDVRGRGSFLFIRYWPDGSVRPIVRIFPQHQVVEVLFQPDK